MQTIAAITSEPLLQTSDDTVLYNHESEDKPRKSLTSVVHILKEKHL